MSQLVDYLANKVYENILQPKLLLEATRNQETSSGTSAYYLALGAYNPGDPSK